MNEIRDEFEQDMDKKNFTFMSKLKNLNSCYNCDEILTAKLEKIMLMQSITVCLRVKPKADLTFKGKNALYYNTNLLCK